MRNKQFIGDIIFFGTLISSILVSLLVNLLFDDKVFAGYGIYRYGWICLIFLLVPISCFLFGVKRKQEREKYKRYKILAVLVGIVYLLCGMFYLINIGRCSYDYTHIHEVEQKYNIDLPDQLKIISAKDYQESFSYAKILDQEENEVFLKKVENDSNWVTELQGFNISQLSFHSASSYIDGFDYCMFYNATTNEYNIQPNQKGKQDCLFLAYKYSIKKIHVIEFTIDN